MGGRGRGNPGELGVDEPALDLLAAHLPQRDQSDLQEVSAVLVHVCHLPQPDNLYGLVLPSNKEKMSGSTSSFGIRDTQY